MAVDVKVTDGIWHRSRALDHSTLRAASELWSRVLRIESGQGDFSVPMRLRLFTA